MPGPLQGVRVVEIAGIGPGPFCAMLLADMGADVIRIERPGSETVPMNKVSLRGRPKLTLDLRSDQGAQAALRLIEKADVLIEGFRPGVMERLGLGPEICLARQKRLVYGRMTGWGQEGPLAKAAGHDINYIAISGALAAIGHRDSPAVPPLNLVGDYGGGAMLLAFGVLAAVIEARQSGQGQVVDAAMSDGAALLCASFYGHRAAGRWSSSREDNILDGAAHFYGSYVCADGKEVSIGSIEPQFYKLLLDLCEIRDEDLRTQQNQKSNWADFKLRIAALFKTRTRAEWVTLLEGTDVCFAPVLDWDEAPGHPHNKARGTFVELDGIVQPAAAPRFSRTRAEARGSIEMQPAAIWKSWGARAPGES